MNDLLLYTIIFIFGSVFGSFLNVVIYRIPRDESIAFPASHCQSCKTPLKLYHNIPIFAWIVLRGKCAFCKEPISIQYPIIEAICGFLFVIVFYKTGLSYQALGIALLFLNLLALSMIDLKYKAVPTSLLVTAVLFSIVGMEDIYAAQRLLLFAGGASMLELFVTYYIQGIKARITKDESLKDQVALGSGDIPVFGIIGALLPLKLAMVAIFLASIFAIIPSIYNSLFKKDIETPFIPFLSLGLLVTYIFGDLFLKWLDFL
jgi:leader peptidase (prepilin peptidase)/N-methyltransferase